MPNVGDVEYKYSRVYAYVRPGAQGPGTWRLSNPDELAGGGGGGGGTIIASVEPIVVDQPTISQADVTFDITSLPYV